MRSNEQLFTVTSSGIFTLSAIIFVVLVLYASTGYPPRARYVPQVIGIFSLICLAIQLVLDCFPALGNRYREVEEVNVFNRNIYGEKAPGVGGTRLQLEINTFSWLVALLAGLLLFGFLISIPFYILFYLRLQAHISWLKSAICAVGTWLFVYLIFARLFEIRLYTGFIIDRFLDI
jgi:hypothetical protein